jgi:hypothetical protein
LIVAKFALSNRNRPIVAISSVDVHGLWEIFLADVVKKVRLLFELFHAELKGEARRDELTLTVGDI